MPFRARLSLAAFLLVASTDIPTLAAQGGPLQPPSTGGVPALLQELRMLGHHKRVLMIGAHPDDEDTELLVLLTRHEGAEAAYLSLTRGEGGQNLIGTELGPALGILRTEELLAARRVDGAGQFFSRAYDFGFSKTIDDAWAHWPRDSVLKDVVRIVRRFRPQVIVSVFSGTPRDGHGQHQAAGWAAAQAFRVAGDPGAFPELATEEGLAPWTPEKLYRSARFDAGAATVTVDGGALEPLSGKTYHQLAMAARSLHRSQDMGVLQDLGPSPTRLALVARRDGRAADPGAGWEAFWSGVDTAWGLPAAHLQALADARAAALGGGELSRALARAVATVAPVADASDIAWSDYLEHLARARALADGVLLDVIAGDDRVVPGDTVALEVLARNTGGATTDPLKAVLSPRGGALFRTELDGALAPGELRRSRFGFRLPAEWAPTTPYYLRAPRDGDLYRWEGDPALRGAAAGPDELALSLEAPGADPHRDGLAWHLARGASSRVRDQANGEIRRPLTVVPRVSVTLAPEVAVVRADARGEARVARFEVTLTHAGEGVARGTVRLTLPWRGVRAPSAPFTLDGPGAEARVAFAVAVPEEVPPGSATIGAEAVDEAGQRYTLGAFTVDYPHIRPRQYTRPAESRVEVMALAAPVARRVGYVRGAADRIPEALAAAGLTVTLLDSTALASGDLGRYDVIVVGPRAYEVDSALVRHNARLLDYARAGGRVVVQYQQQVFVQGSFAPFPVTESNPADRITDEGSPVAMLGEAPGRSAVATLFRAPNAIGPEDWQGWIQDRALYCLHSWDPRYTSLLSSSDPGEAPLGGCLVQARVGRGTYLYTGLAFFRQLPAGVPGAFRLFYNLLGGAATP